jgi:hypothetical protein
LILAGEPNTEQVARAGIIVINHIAELLSEDIASVARRYGEARSTPRTVIHSQNTRT